VKVLLTEDAERDLDAYLDHIEATDSVATAARVEQQVIAALQRLAEAPVMGRKVQLADWPRPVHRSYVRPFRVYYERRPDTFVIVRLYHGARRPIER
jgi:plasmid stabilization system protein ParE